MWAQGGATTGIVAGDVTDQTGAAVAGAEVTLTDTATKAYHTQPTNTVGRYIFASVNPGTYDIKVTLKGFRVSAVTGQQVIVGQTLTVNVSLEVGATTQTVEVKATPGAELQTMNSTIGSTLGGSTLLSLPNVNRDATTLLVFQPMTAPTFHGTEGNTTGGQVAGSMSDQNTFTLDGGNATDDLAGDNNYIAPNRGYAGPQAAIPTPVESIEEFKVATNNQTADFSASAGGQVMLVTKRGTNTFHGSAYDYFQADWLNAAGWDLNSTYNAHLTPVKQHQNRFGGSVGGPMLPSMAGGKTYFYFNFEGRRYPYANGKYERIVPSDTLRQGIIELRDTSSPANWIPYNLKTSMQCGTAGNAACDPRGIGLNPVVSQLWSTYMPEPNDCDNYGDHHNTCGYYSSLKLPIKDDFAVVRFDHDFGAKWRFNTSYRYYKLDDPSTNQVDIGGILKGDTKGVLASGSSNPQQPRYIVAGMTGTLTPTLTNDFHISYLRNDWNWIRAGAPVGQLGIPGGLEVETTTGESTGGGNLLAPMNFDTQSARFRTWDGHDWNYSDTLGWLKGKHFMQFGGNILHWWDDHVRDDNVTGSLSELVYQINKGTGLFMSTAYQPMHCTADGQTNCLNTTYASTWNNLYAMTLGFVGTAQQLIVRGGSNFSTTGASYLEDRSITDGYSLYYTDSFKVRPNLTINYGLEWGVVMPPYELNGVQDFMTDSTGAALSYNQYVSNVASYAANGTVYNPVIGFEPIRGVGGSPKYPIDPFYGGFSPRISLAWNPNADSGILHTLFGNKKTVIRGGYSRIYDRTNAVNMVLSPLLGYGFGQPVSCNGAGIIGGVAGCYGTNSTDPTNGFRIGVDGNTSPFPAIAQTLPIPAEPGIAQFNPSTGLTTTTPPATVLFSLDSKWRPGTDDSIDFSIQRELPGQIILEVGYAGKWMKHTYLGMNNDGVPYMLSLGGQSFAQAYNQLYQADRAGTAIAPQPFIETAFGANNPYCATFASCSAAVLAKEGAGGTANITYQAVYPLFQDLDRKKVWNFPGCVGCPILSEDLQGYHGIDVSTTNGFGNYQAGFLSVQKRTGHGLTLSGNLTWSHTLNTVAINQEYVEDSPNNIYNLRADYAPAPYDRTWVANVLGRYELPFGKGKRFSTTNPILDRIIGGWSVSPIWTWATGLPIETFTGSCTEFGTGQYFPWCAGAVPLTNTGSFGKTPHMAVSTANQSGVGAYGAYGACTVGVLNDPSCNGAGVGTGGNLFADPTKSYNSYRPAILGLDTRAYDTGPFYGQHRWNVDMTIEKYTKITERVGISFYAQMLNAFNNIEYNDPSMNIQDPGDWGALYTQYNQPRIIELGLRLAF